MLHFTVPLRDKLLDEPIPCDQDLKSYLDKNLDSRRNNLGIEHFPHPIGDHATIKNELDFIRGLAYLQDLLQRIRVSQNPCINPHRFIDCIGYHHGIQQDPISDVWSLFKYFFCYLNLENYYCFHENRDVPDGINHSGQVIRLWEA
jgi:hypothetical protein